MVGLNENKRKTSGFTKEGVIRKVLRLYISSLYLGATTGYLR